MSIKKMTYVTAATLLMSAPAYANNLPTDFASLDTDKNGSVTFSEYQAHSQTLGLSTTQAAQDFTRAAQGDAVLTEEELSLALAFEDQPYALQNFSVPVALSTEPAPLPVTEMVEEAPVTAYEPMVIEPEPTETEIIEPEITETPLEDVMGEIETHTPDTPAEEGITDIDGGAEDPQDPS